MAPSRRPFANPPDHWTDLDALVRAMNSRVPEVAGVVPARLVEARRVVETADLACHQAVLDAANMPSSRRCSPR